MASKSARNKKRKKRGKNKPRKATSSLSKMLERREQTRIRQRLSRAQVAGRGRLLSSAVNHDWREEGLAFVRVVRQRTDDIQASASFLVDLHGIGCKDADLRLSEPKGEEGSFMVDTEIEIGEALAIVRAGLEWGRKLGFDDPRDLEAALCLFGDARPAALEVACGGPDGRPLYTPGPQDDFTAVTDKLRRAVGPGGFGVLLPGELFGRDELDAFVDFVDGWLAEDAEERKAEAIHRFVETAAAVWNASLEHDDPDEAAAAISAAKASRGEELPDLETVVRPLLLRRQLLFAECDFEIDEQAALLATLALQGSLVWD